MYCVCQIDGYAPVQRQTYISSSIRKPNGFAYTHINPYLASERYEPSNRHQAKLRQRLRALRAECKLSRAELAKLAGSTAPVYARYERSERAPAVDTAHALASALGVALDYLVGEAAAPLRDKAMLYRLQLLDDAAPSDRDRIIYMLDLLLKDAHAGTLERNLA